MKALEYYLSNENDPSLLPIKEQEPLDLNVLRSKSIVFVEKKTLAICAERSLLWGGARRVSPDGKWLEFASLFGGTKVSAGLVDVSGPIEIFFVNDDNVFQCSYSFKSSWEGYGPDGLLVMSAPKDVHGIRRPLVNIRSVRGERSKYNECLIWLPKAPSKIEKVDGGAVLWSHGEKFFVDQEASKSIDEGWVKWVLPNKAGLFELPTN
jgi:hypothetical protein